MLEAPLTAAPLYHCLRALCARDQVELLGAANAATAAAADAFLTRLYANHTTPLLCIMSTFS